MNRCALRVLTAVAVLLVMAQSALGQATGAVTDGEAADLARFVSDRAASVRASGPSARVEAKAQARIDGLAAAAGALESAIRSGASKSETRKLYEALRRQRLGVIALAQEHDLGLSLSEVSMFEQMMAELSAYYRTPAAPAQ